MSNVEGFADIHYFKPYQVNVAAELLWRNNFYKSKKDAYSDIFDLIRACSKKGTNNSITMQKGKVIVQMINGNVNVYIDPTPKENKVVEVEQELVDYVCRM